MGKRIAVMDIGVASLTTRQVRITAIDIIFNPVKLARLLPNAAT